MNKEQKERYSRQILFEGLGENGQEKLLQSSAVIVGCGALGTVSANLLVRAGVGRLRLIDRDFVEPSNLQRQMLFEESDARESLPKAFAAERHLRAINSCVHVQGVVADLTSENAAELLSGFDVIIDGTDNFESRLLINDASIFLCIPWIYAAAVGSYGLTMSVLPGQSACLACLLESEDFSNSLGAEPTCDTAGVLNAAVSVVASIQAAEATKILAGQRQSLHGRLISCDVWSGRFQSVRVPSNPECRACTRREFSYLEGIAQPHITLCGRDSVQIHARSRRLDLGDLSRRLAPLADEIRNNDFLLRFRIATYDLTVFADGRAIIKGTKDLAVARSLYARYIGV